MAAHFAKSLNVLAILTATMSKTLALDSSTWDVGHLVRVNIPTFPFIDDERALWAARFLKCALTARCASSMPATKGLIHLGEFKGTFSGSA